MFSGLVCLCLLSLTSTYAQKLQLSTDNGRTWEPFNRPLDVPPLNATARLVDHPSSLLHLPSCALKGSLRVQIWRSQKSDHPIGLRWHSTVCHPHVTLADGVSVEHIALPRYKPDWIAYIRQHDTEESSPTSETQREKGFFAKYGLYIMIFVGVALAQGIRKGLAELHEEMEREELKKKETSKPSQMKIVVPRRRESAKARKRTTSSGAK